MKLLILLLLISINGFGQNKKYKNITISGNEQMLPVFIQVKHSVELKDTIKLSPDLELILGTGCFGVDMIHIKGTNYYLPISGRGDSMWLYIKPKPNNGSSQKVYNNWNIGNAVMAFKSPFDDDTTKIESGNGEFATPSVSFTLPNAARKVFDKPQPKTDIVKGWIRYLRLRTFTEHYFVMDSIQPENSFAIKGHEVVRVDTLGIDEIKEMAVAVYDVTVEQLPHTTCLGCLDDLMVHVGEVKRLSKILVNGKPFDLSKKYEFIRDDEIVK